MMEIVNDLLSLRPTHWYGALAALACAAGSAAFAIIAKLGQDRGHARLASYILSAGVVLRLCCIAFCLGFFWDFMWIWGGILSGPAALLLYWTCSGVVIGIAFLAALVIPTTSRENLD